ncbi:2Fe-2S iron-sulfur cluster-binding protein [Bdellovibrio sp. KM01]|uniref:2Fe-2S iron-sulfur cluster-binding protein n=1 Tax=Bdellovibrio sp. KM01 TaxID=2748865 RepID=UPI0015E9CE43|nr:2Fe-2S iron-sulfur cluster-binding protein [Bdellovibrio sp. KM01]QLY25810.1 (2Fe-2S)-binding protein [Bdellovibrio sp. KM01]
MPVISFKKNRTPLTVETGANLMEALLNGGLPVASSCSGDGVCAKCRIQIVSGAENLTVENETEKFLRETKKVASDSRISCQAQVMGDITVDASYW